eukprot:jgi/Chrzof1/4728/Cz14g24040.t1
MPPKKTANAKDDPAKLSDKELLQKAQADRVALQRLLELKTHEALDAKKSERAWREKAEAVQKELEQHKEDTKDITADMMRQHKTMQEQMSKRIADLEATQHEMSHQLEEKEANIAALRQRHAELQKSSNAQVSGYQQRIDQLQLEFAAMLKDTLDKMHERLETTHSSKLMS